MKDKGFTLIELLVVIAIIGILASIVLVALGGAREQARDARITSEMGQLRSKAELIKTSEGGYNVDELACSGTDADDEVVALCDDISEQGGSVTIVASEDKYCAYTPLNSGKNYCVDSTGNTLSTTTAIDCTDSSPTDYTCEIN